MKMNNFGEQINGGATASRVLISIIVCNTLVYIAVLIESSYSHPEYRFPFSIGLIWPALLTVFLFAGSAIFFFLGREFSFGYILAYYFYVLIVGFLWINQFTILEYDRLLAGVSAAGSFVAFCIPALLIRWPFRHSVKLPLRAAEFVLFAAILLSALIILFGVRLSFHYQYLTYDQLRDELLRTARIRGSVELPRFFRYCVSIVTSAVLPFAFACFVERRQYWWAAVTLLMLASFFPIIFTKTSLLSPFWLVLVALVASAFDARSASVLTLFAPMAVGLVALHGPGDVFGDIFQVLDFRLMVIPSAALSFYNDFFSEHPRTLFCQIGIIRSAFGCPYQEQLGEVLSRTYGLGNYNASLFATEGVASVGALLSPISAFACGLIIGGVNGLSAGLPSRFVMVSSSSITFAFLNVPFSTTLVTHGGALLFLLWYLLPREFLKKEAGC
jgi:hypothetical protein